MVSAISFGWFAEFGKTLPLFNARPNQFILTNGKHPWHETEVFNLQARELQTQPLTLVKLLAVSHFLISQLIYLKFDISIQARQRQAMVSSLAMSLGRPV